MGWLRRSWRDLPKSALLAALAVFVVFFSVLVQERHLQQKIGQVAHKSQRLSELHRQREFIEAQHHGYQYWSNSWESIRQQGFLEEQPSSRWIDFLDMLERSGGVVVTRMVLPKTDPLSKQASSPDDSAPLDWQVSIMSLGMELLHEGYLALFLQGLRDRFTYRVLPRRCQILARKKVLNDVQTPSLPLQLDCQIYWFNTRRGGAR